ncbi:MAG: phosphatidylglycerol lysyltransferase [Candidatus Auribacterota bacterium]
MVYDERTGFEIGDPAIQLIPAGTSLSKEDKEIFLKNTILSVSGWRRVFAVDGDEESTTPEIGLPDKIMVGSCARLFTEFLCAEQKKKRPTIAVGLDARHTGPVIGMILIRAFLAYGCNVQYLFIAGAPEIMAYAKTNPDIDGFMYVTASHNPIGHNGLKFGLNDGAVIGKAQAQPLIDKFKVQFFNDKWIEELVSDINAVDVMVVKDVFSKINMYKNEALRQYREFTDAVITGITDKSGREEMLATIRRKIKAMNVGVLAEFNGSARAVSIDVDYLKQIGLQVTALNDKPRQIVHRIVPEGQSLDLARQELEKLSASNKAYRFAYVPDCDGDRGNIVTLDARGKSWILEAQEVFALSVVSELAYLVYAGTLTYDSAGNPQQKVAVVVNGPTSGRIEKIAEAFGAEVFRAEVGEANVVSLAALKQKQGYIVRILGEGSNGGNITLPSTVRDPINTIFAFIKMLVLRSENGKPGLFEIWAKRSGNMSVYCADFELYNVVESLPVFTTTSAFENRAIVRITTEDHAKLKAEYEKVFLGEWDNKKSMLKEKLGIEKYRVLNYEGIETKEGIGSKFRSGAERGGLKVLFEDCKGSQAAFIWMRGSGTEPVFRVLADVRGDNPAAEKILLDWHVSMIQQADKA